VSTDILFVNPLFLHQDPVESQLMTPYFPLGILYVAAAARDAGHSVAVFDAMFAESDADFLRALEQHQPKVVGLGVLATVRKAALRLALLAKQRGAMVVVGGADPTARPQVYLEHHEQELHPVDVVTLGEAEGTIGPLLKVLLAEGSRSSALARIDGIAYRDETGQIVRSSSRPLIRDVDAIPLPARDLIDLEAYRRAWQARHGVFTMSLIASRGCPYDCAWCQKTVFGRSFRPRAPGNVADEMRLIKETYRPDRLRIVDDVMGIDRKWVRHWHDAVLQKDAAIPFECLSRVDLVDEEVARLLQEAGCTRIAFGTESGSQRILDAMHKGTTVDQIRRAARICRKLGIETYFYMMVGYPGEEWQDLQRSVRLLRETQPDAFSTTIAYPLPGTAFYEDVRHLLPYGDVDTPDWDYTAENKLLFPTGRYNTAFYRRVIRWFHSEWRDARLPHRGAFPWQRRLRAKLGLWRDRVLVNVLARVPLLSTGAWASSHRS
jgi:anaerobic magnesium-protoporphyrin IX monomethyl ester cyclase